MDPRYISKCRLVVEMAREGNVADASFQVRILRNRSHEFFRSSEEMGLYHWAAGEVALSSGNTEGAINALRSSLEILLATKSMRETYGDVIADAYLTLAKASVKGGNYGEAAESYSEGIKYATLVDGEDSWARVLSVIPAQAGAMFLAGDGQAQVILDEGLRRTRSVFGTHSQETNTYIKKTCSVLRSVGREKDVAGYEKILESNSIDEAAVVLEELDAFIGLDEVKKHFHSVYQMQNLSRLRQRDGLPAIPVVMHLALLGPSGTGKTTVAHLAARLYQALELLPTSRVVLATGGEMVSSHKSSASKKVNDLCDEARGGVLLVNEAYALKDEDRNQAVATLLDRMEEERGNFALIVTGYKDAMESLLENNEGLRLRFGAILEFTQYSPTELGAIFRGMCEEYKISLSPEAEGRLIQVATEAGGARTMRQLFQDSISRQAERISRMSSPSREDLTILLPEDINP